MRPTILRLLAIIATGLMVAALVPPFSYGTLAWICMVPLLIALWSLKGKHRAKKGFLIGYLAADHDPAVFADPEHFDPERTNLGDVVAFGRGIHYCPGAALARMEARIAFEELTKALDGYRIPAENQLEWNSSFQLRAIPTLPFTPTRRD